MEASSMIMHIIATPHILSSEANPVRLGDLVWE